MGVDPPSARKSLLEAFDSWHFRRRHEHIRSRSLQLAYILPLDRVAVSQIL